MSLHDDRGVSAYWWGCLYVLVGVYLCIGRGVCIYWWGYLYVLVGVSLDISMGVSAC